jgi:hypothetical protein
MKTDNMVEDRQKITYIIYNYRYIKFSYLYSMICVLSFINVVIRVYVGYFAE